VTPSGFVGRPVKAKGKVYPITGHEGREGEWRYSAAVSLTSALDGVEGQRHAPAALPPGKSSGWEAGWAPGLVWTGAENLASTGIRSPNRLTRSESLYRLSYPDTLGRPVLGAVTN
jgi:hypothetical protein